MSASILRMTAAELGEKIAARQLTAEAVATAFLDQIEAVDGDVKAFLFVDRDWTLEQARAVDARLDAGEKLGPLAGVPIAVKDIFCTEGVPTTCASKILEGWKPPYDATIITRLRDAGLVMLGKTNMDEFAMGSSTENSAFQVTGNPWALDCIPGGSGGGSAAALAAFEAPLALGTDTGGSIRQPAAVTGSVGVKPTYGGTSRYGVIAMASSLDQPGPCARTVLDAALLHEVICGHDPMDSTSIDQPVPPVVAAAREASVDGMKIGVVKELTGAGYDAGVQQRFDEALEVLRAQGAEIVEVSCPHFELALGAYYLIMPSEVSSNLARFDAMRYGLRAGDDGQNSVEDVMRLTRGEGFGDEVKRRIIIGTYALSAGYRDAFYGSAQKARRLIADDFEAAWGQVDVLVSPATPSTAFKQGERTADPLAMYMSDLATIPSNMAGNASGSFPCGLAPADGLPVGFQVMAPVLADDRVYRVGAALERGLSETWGGTLLDQLADGEQGAYLRVAKEN